MKHPYLLYYQNKNIYSNTFSCPLFHLPKSIESPAYLFRSNEATPSSCSSYQKIRKFQLCQVSKSTKKLGIPDVSTTTTTTYLHLILWQHFSKSWDIDICLNDFGETGWQTHLFRSPKLPWSETSPKKRRPYIDVEPPEPQDRCTVG